MKTDTYKIAKPANTFYTDYRIQDGKLYAIFEHGIWETVKFVCKTQRKNITSLKETHNEYIITL